MARPKKTGLDYFPHDVDMSHDEKIEAMEAIYQELGYCFYNKLLERIYRAGGELDISDAEIQQILIQKLARNEAETFQKLLNSSLKFGLFDTQEYENRSILTSSGIKKRVEMVTKKREKMAKSYQNRVSDAETCQKPIQKPDKGKERKEKERKEKKINIDTHIDTKESPLDTALASFVEMRKKLRKPMTERAKELLIKKLNSLTPEINSQIKILEQSVLRSWQGVFPLKDDDQKQQSTDDYSEWQ